MINKLSQNGKKKMGILFISAIVFGAVHLTNIAGIDFVNVLVQIGYAFVIGNVGEIKVSRIVICGLNGCGKTTLGKKLAQRINYLHKDIEDYYFNNNIEYKYDKPCSRDDVSNELEKDFNNYENIIFTTCKGDYDNLSNLYDLAILIRLDKDTRLKRVKERSYKQFGDRIFENGDLYEKETKFWNMVYNKDESVITDWFNSLECKKIEIDGKKNIEENLGIILDFIKS